MRRPLPTAQETVRILAARRPRPFPAPPPVAARALTPALKALESRFGQGADGLKARWRDIVGVDLARRTEPTRLVKARIPGPVNSHDPVQTRDAAQTPGGAQAKAPRAKSIGPKKTLPGPPPVREGATLELRVEGPSAAIIQHRAADIISRVNLFLGAGAVTRLRIVQGPLRGLPRQEAVARVASGRRLKTPLDAAAEQALAADLEGFPEGPLKAALARLGREVMREAQAGAERHRGPRPAPDELGSVPGEAPGHGAMVQTDAAHSPGSKWQ